MVREGLSAYGRQVFDQRVGRALWLAEGGYADLVATRVGQFTPSRQGDLWSGVGFGCSNYGITGCAGLEYLREASGPWWSYLADGVALEASARSGSDNLTSDTDLICRILCGIGAREMIQWPEEAERDLTAERKIPRYERWRESIRAWLWLVNKLVSSKWALMKHRAYCLPSLRL
jgi:hypothetical protein